MSVVPKIRKPAPAMPHAAPAKQEAEKIAFSLQEGVNVKAQGIVLYGPGGVGKTSLAALIGQIEGVDPVFIDLDNGTNFLDVKRISPTPQTFQQLLDAVLAAKDLCNCVIIDSLTKAEELAVQHTLQTVPHEKGNLVSSIEGYGFGKGYVHVYESFLLLLQACDYVKRHGCHVIGICHDCTANVPNPAGEDWIRYEPRLQSPPSGKGSIRHRVKEWCDHLLYVGFDTWVEKDGKAKGSGSRTIWPAELPTHWAKSRSLRNPIAYVEGDVTLWESLIKEQ